MIYFTNSPVLLLLIDPLYWMGVFVELWDHLFAIGYQEMKQHSKLKYSVKQKELINFINIKIVIVLCE